MPVFLCKECLKNHEPSPSDELCNLYCVHTYAILKAKACEKKKETKN